MTMSFARFTDIDWQRWRARQHATLLFVVRGAEILLIRKKRGIGAGKINGPGGRVEPGERPLEAAVREVEEELGVTPLEPAAVGDVLFQVTDGLAMHIHVFLASECHGEPYETDEAVPLWAPLDAIPYGEMWETDRYWMPLMLAGTRFEIRTLFEDDRLLGHELITLGAVR